MRTINISTNEIDGNLKSDVEMLNIDEDIRANEIEGNPQDWTCSVTVVTTSSVASS